MPCIFQYSVQLLWDICYTNNCSTRYRKFFEWVIFYQYVYSLVLRMLVFVSFFVGTKNLLVR